LIWRFIGLIFDLVKHAAKLNAVERVQEVEKTEVDIELTVVKNLHFQP
jgi:hypothetical protein